MSSLAHRHGSRIHSHPHDAPHRHLILLRQSQALTDDEPHHHPHDHSHDRDHSHTHGHGERGHSHGLVDRSLLSSREGLKAVAWSLGILGLAAAAQTVIFILTNSVALLADLIHNFGDALTAVPLAIAFYLRSFRIEKIAGLFVVLAILISACVALYETIQRFIHPQQLTHLWVLAAAGLIGFVGNESAAQVRLRTGRRIASPALIADGNHARIDGFVSLGVIGKRDRRRAWLRPRRPDHRPRHHRRDPQDHLGLLANSLDHRTRLDQSATPLADRPSAGSLGKRVASHCGYLPARGRLS